MNFIVLYRYLLSERIKCSIWYRNSFSECDSTATKSPPLNRLQKNWKRKKILKDKQINKFNTTNTSFICICAVDSLTYSYVMKSFNRVYKVTVFAICMYMYIYAYIPVPLTYNRFWRFSIKAGGKEDNLLSNTSKLSVSPPRW